MRLSPYILILLVLSLIPEIAHAQNDEELSYNISLLSSPEDEGLWIVSSNPPHWDRHGFLWYAAQENLICFDGQRATRYNFTAAGDTLQINQDGYGFLSMAGLDSSRIWLIFFDNINFHYKLCLWDTDRRQVMKEIRLEDKFALLYLCQDIATRKSYFIARHRKSDLGHVYEMTEDTSLLFKTKLPVGSSSPPRVLQDTIWIFKDLSLIALDRMGNELMTLPAYGSFELTNQPGLHIMRASEEKSLSVDPIRQIVKPIEIKNAEFEGSSYNTFTFPQEVWLSDFKQRVWLYNSTTKTTEDYTSELAELNDRFDLKKRNETLQQVISYGADSYILVFNSTLYLAEPVAASLDDWRVPVSQTEPYPSVRQICEDSEGNVYVSYYTDVSVCEAGTESFRSLRLNPQNTYNEAFSLSTSATHLIWDNYRYRLSDLQLSRLPGSLKKSMSLHLHEKDTLWTYDRNARIFKTQLESMRDTIIQEALFDKPIIGNALIRNQDQSESAFILATDLRGIHWLDRRGHMTKQMIREDLGLTRKNTIVTSLHQAKGDLYYGTHFGLAVIREGENQGELLPGFARKQDGEDVHDAIYFIHPLADSRLLLGTGQGLLIYRMDTGLIERLPDGHPLSQVEYNRNAHFSASDGHTYLGSVEGLFRINPDILPFASPKESISDLFVHNVSIYNSKFDEYRSVFSDLMSRTEPIKLLPSDELLTMRYSSPSITDDRWYAYSLNGEEGSWSRYDTRSELELISLPTGAFTVHLRASADPQGEQYAEHHIDFYRPAVWYHRRWVQALGLLLACGIVFGVFYARFRAKVNKEKALNQWRVKVSSDLHDDVGSILSGLAMQSEIMSMTAKEEDKESLAEMNEMSRDAMERMRDTVWLIDSRKDKYENLIDRMRAFAQKRLPEQRWAVDFQVTGIDSSKSMSPTLRQQLYLIHKEAITNIQKHSDGNAVAIRLVAEGPRLSYTVHDNGSKHELLSTDGLGISNMRLRAEQIRGTLKIDREDGYRIRLVMPLDE